ncbi:MAG TPA: hypothetical protein VE685_18785 [Thermoanaerobaculia bacterium]|nr:hypothetical protein [Thermoanaerobaculia bacterium]
MRKRSLNVAGPLVFALALVALPAAAQTYAELFQQATAAYGQQEWPRCASLFASAARAATHDSEAARAFFAAAACSTGAGDKEAAFGYLDQAAEKGHRDVERATGNPQIEPLRSDPRWKAFLAGVEARSEAYKKGSNAELERLYTEDQADRAQGPNAKIDWEAVSKRDEERRKRVLEILEAGGAKTAADYHHAAMVFQHGDTLDDYDRAHKLAAKAAELDPEHPGAKWLAAAAKDRWLMNQGKPQLYGTQFKMVDGKWVLWDVDPSVTDEERAKWDCPPLEVARKRAEELNAQRQ